MDEFVFETVNDKRYAPSMALFNSNLFDAELEKEIHSIPNKFAFKIGEVAKMVGVESYVLRYWETEFEELRPTKSQKGQRAYSKKDIEFIYMIRKLLHRDRFSIEGARTALKKLKKDVKQVKAAGATVDPIEVIRVDVEDLLAHIQALKTLFS
jgi:DNA-binding transcriptional MerR regulator